MYEHQFVIINFHVKYFHNSACVFVRMDVCIYILYIYKCVCTQDCMNVYIHESNNND